MRLFTVSITRFNSDVASPDVITIPKSCNADGEAFMAVNLIALFAVLIGPQTGPTPKLFKGSENYPPKARRRGEQGTVVMDLTVDTSGKVKACVVTRSSGSRSLDYTSCKAATARIRYNPATDTSGAPTLGNAVLSINWRIGCRSPVIDPQADGIQVCVDPVR